MTYYTSVTWCLIALLFGLGNYLRLMLKQYNDNLTNSLIILLKLILTVLVCSKHVSFTLVQNAQNPMSSCLSTLFVPGT